MQSPTVATRASTATAGDGFPCGTCGLLFDGRPELVSHYKGELHRTNLQRKVASKEPLSHEEFEARAEAQSDAPQDKKDARTRRQDARLEQQLRGKSGGKSGGGIKALERTQCIFSRKKFDTVELAVDHMKKNYGFFIPDAECLTDLYGLMDFLREMVVTEHCCWFCGKVGRSYEATVGHMVDKSHCKLPFEGSHPDLAPYFSFGADHASSADAWVRVDDASAPPICGAVGAPYTAAAEAAAAKAERLQKLAPPPAVGAGAGAGGGGGEEDWEQVDGDHSSDGSAEDLEMPQTVGGGTALVLPDGRVLGHRSMQRYYRQAPRPQRPAVTGEEGGLSHQARLEAGGGWEEEGDAMDVDEDADTAAAGCDFYRFSLFVDCFQTVSDEYHATDLLMARPGAGTELVDGERTRAGRRVVVAAPPVDIETRKQATHGEARRDRQRYKASEGKSKSTPGFYTKNL